MSLTKCVLYARVSSKEQDETGYSLPAQEKLLKEYAQQRELKIEKLFSIAESASGQKQRQVFGDMLEILKRKKVKVLICEKVDRLTRNIKDAVLMNDWINESPEHEIHFAKENWILTKESKSNEKFIWNIRVSVSQYYTDNLSEEVKKGQKEKIAQGWLPTKPPLGYKTIGEKGHKIHVLDENKAPLIKKMFELYSTGNYSMLRLVNTMYDLGLRTRGGNKFGKSRLSSTLGDPFYYGKIRWKDKIYQGKQEPLISKELFNLVQNTTKSKTTPKYGKHLFTFKGLIECRECGGKITWETHKGITYGHCNHYRNCSQKVWHKEKDIENKVEDILGNLKLKNSRIYEWVKKTIKENQKDTFQLHESTVKDLNQRLSQIQIRLDRIYDDKLDGKISEEFYQRKFDQFSKEKEDIAEAIQKHSEVNNDSYKLNLSFFELAQKAKNVFISSNDPEKRKSLIRLILREIKLDDNEFKYEFTKTFQLISQATGLSNGSKIENLPVFSEKNFEPTDFLLNKTKTASKQGDFVELLRG